MATILKRMTENLEFVNRKKQDDLIVGKWEDLSLLEGLQTDNAKMSKTKMARLLENEAKFLFKEATSMQAGDVEGFASAAFPMVRRIFASLFANDLVSVQPMNMPSTLIFFLDFTTTDSRGGYVADESVYGGQVVAKGLSTGVDLTGAGAEKGFYNNQNGYSSPISSSTGVVTVIASGTVGGTLNGTADAGVIADIEDLNVLAKHDPDLSGSAVVLASVPVASLPFLDVENYITLAVTSSLSAGARQVRRLTSKSADGTNYYLWFEASASDNTAVNNLSGAVDATLGFQYAIQDNYTNGGALGSVVGGIPFGLESQMLGADGTFLHDVTGDIPEIDLKVDSIPVLAKTKQLKAKWSRTVNEDLQAYQNTDAEVELTNILSQHVGLEIDREIIVDLINGGTAGVLYWSRRPGKFVNRETGADVTSATAPPDFTGNVSEWYQTLLEVINDLSARMYRKLIHGGATFLVCSPEVASILEMVPGFSTNVAVDDDRGDAGTMKVGTLKRKWDVFVDPYFPRQLILVGRKGNAFLESGYVYAPYVPLEITPAIMGPEDFEPRKGVRTRYAKKMVRPDHYGLVVVQDLLG